VDADATLTVGHAARLAGVTTKALRHYDRIGLLRPAAVDPATGYRRYRPEQVDQARLIRRMRAMELPLDEICRLLALSGDRPAFVAALTAHRRRVEARVTRLRGVLHLLDHAISDDTTGTAAFLVRTAMTETASLDPSESPALHERWGKNLFNDTWRLMEKEDRTPDEDALMAHQAHASLYHWLRCGTPANAARGEWQVSRVYCVLRRPEPAVYHARRVLDICQRNGIGDWDLAFAYEALARAYAVAGDGDEARRWLEQARLASVDIAEDDDRDLLLADLETIPVVP
jgi:DNA-binding transcriptional MerR regulator